MDKRLLVSTVLVFLVIGLFFFVEKDSITNYPPKGDTILVFGDSLVSGVGASEGKNFVSLLGASLKKPVLNLGVPGDTTQSALIRIGESLELKPDIVLVLLGGNDALKKIPKEETEQNLISIVQKFQTGGAVVVVLGVRGGLLGDPYSSMYERITKVTGSILVPDVLDDIFGDMRYMSDAIHPNDAGYERIARRIIPIIRELIGESL